MNEETDVAKVAVNLVIELCKGNDKSPEMVAAISKLLEVILRF